MTKLAPQTIKLKNDQIVTIREAEIDDAEKLLKCLKTYIPQSEYIPKLEHEITLTLEQEKQWIASFLKSNNSLLLVAELDGEIIGNIDFTGNQRELMAHTAVLGMGMIDTWRNQGLGTAFIQVGLQWAKENPILKLIWLQVYSDNLAGLNLYRKMGFQECGTLPHFFRNQHGYSDNVTMYITVN